MKNYELLDQLARDTREVEVTLRDVEARLSELGGREAQLEASIADALSRLGKIHLEHNVDIGQEAGTVLRLREAEERELRANLRVVERDIGDLLEEARQANAEIEVAHARQRDYLYGDPDYVEALKARNAARASRDWLRAYGDELEQECARKLPAYDTQPLFAYLARQGYGEPHYRATGLIRALDGWIARLCDYQRNRTSHVALIGMRDELAYQKAALADQLVKSEAVIANATATAVARAGMEAAQRKLRAIEERIAVAKRQAGEMNEQLVAYAECRDARYMRARELVARRLGEQSIDLLFQKARSTATLADDEIVIALSEMYEQRSALQHERRALQSQRDAAAAQYERAKSLERELRLKQAETSQDSYDNLDWGKLFVGYMSGALNARDIEQSLRRHAKRMGF